MDEDTTKTTLSTYLLNNKKNFVKEFHFEDCAIDFVVKNGDGTWYGIEAKGSKMKETHTIGQLLHYYQHSSHIILCAPQITIDKIISKLKPNPETQSLINKLGILSINENNEVQMTKEPRNEKYYFKLPSKSSEKAVYGPPKYGILDSLDEFILNTIRERKIILMAELWQITRNENKTKTSLEALRKRLKNLVHFKYIKYSSKYPITVSPV